MGASEFQVTKKGKDAQSAFSAAIQDAQYEYGHGGYTGTIAEKIGFIEIRLPEGIDPYKFINNCWDFDPEDEEQEHYDLYKRASKIMNEKWGPCLCINLGNDLYLFAGLAST